MYGKWAELPVFDFMDVSSEVLAEAKSIGWKNKWDELKRIQLLGMAVKLGGFLRDIRRRKARNARAKFLKIKEEFRKKGWAVLSDFIEGRLGRAEAEAGLRKLMREYYRKAFELGHESSGMADWVELSDRDHEWVNSSYKEEVRYLVRFLDDIESGNGKVDYRKRWEMYVETLEHVFFSGKMVSVPEGYVIDWVMNRSAEHCGGCEFLRKNSPYTRNSLPTVPKAGATPCLSNCRCRLRVRLPKSREEYVRANRKSRKSILLQLRKIKQG